MKHRQLTLLLLATGSLFMLLPGHLRSQEEQLDPDITVKELMAHVDYLADDDLEGREAGTEGARLASDYIAEQFGRIGLKPMGQGNTYFQNFELPKGFTALPETSLLVLKGKQEKSFEFKEEIYPASCSTAGEVEGEVVFAGYGISAPDFEYDDYEELDPEGKIVVVMRGLPGPNSSKNPFNNRNAARRYASFRAKQDTAAGLGAAGLVVINDPANHKSKAKDVLEALDGQDSQGRIPCLRMTYAAGRKMLSGTGITLAKVQKQIDSRLAPRSREVPTIRLQLKAAIEQQSLKVRNVAGLLESTSPQKKDEVLLVGGHFDHVGLGNFGSLGGSKAKGQVHNGADDNASGVAGVMEIAGYLHAQRDRLLRDVLFVCFTAEEMGLLGSKHYVNAPLVPLEKTVAMINLDMLGYLARTKKLEIYGTGTAPTFDKLVTDVNRDYRIKTKRIEGPGAGYSDHAPFNKKGLPILFFITGLHKNYHRPSDDVKYLDKRGFEKVVRLVGQVACELAMAEKRPLFTPTRGGGELDSGPYLGISVESDTDGISVIEVAKKSPAARAGLKAKDCLVELNDQEITSMSLFYGLWSEVNPEERVTFLIRRSGRLQTVRISLKS